MNKESMEQLKSSHDPEAISQRLHTAPKHSYLRDFIYGAVDGVVTTFAVVSGVAGAELSSRIVIILGLSNLIADGFSMAVSNYLGTRAEEQQRERVRKMEEEHIRKVPEGEREEIRQIFAAKGFSGAELERIVLTITSNPRLWVETMLREEHGLPLEGPSPWRAALSTWTAFILVGALPLLPFFWMAFFPSSSAGETFRISTLTTGGAFFVVGAFKARFVGQRWWFSGFETLLAGATAAALAYGVGVLLKGLIP